MRSERIFQQRGVTSQPWFRAPFGAINDTVRRIADEQGFNLVGWTVDSGDWQNGATTQQIVETMTSGICPGAITIMHGSRDYNRAALPQVIDFLQAEGYETVTLSELIPASD
jgi:peptidoglycan/xylan/chitin deacetylase (PgdA/CDA1 family)